MLSKSLRLIIAFFIPVLIIIIIIISIFLPSKNSSKEEIERQAEFNNNKRAKICLSEGHVKGSSKYHDCILDKLMWDYN